MLRVAQIIDTLKVGGAQRLLVTFAENVPEDGARLTFITLSDSDDASELAIARRLQAVGGEVFSLPGRTLFDPGRFRRLFRHLRQTHYDVVHSHLTYANILAGFAGRLSKRPVLATLHNVRPSQQGRLHRELEGLSLRLAKRVEAVGGEVARAYHQRWPALDIEVVPNAVTLAPMPDPSQRRQLRQQLMQNGAGPILLAVGRLTRQKGYPDMLQAFSCIRAQHPQAHLLIAGTGDGHAALAAQIARVGLADHVQLLGLRDDVPDLLAAADIFVSASHWEGLPVALLEAMGAGLPVVATAVGDVPVALADGCGLLVPPQQPTALAEAVARLLATPALRAEMGAKARARVAERYGAQAWTGRLLDLYRQIATEAVR